MLTVVASLFSAVHGWGLAGGLIIWPVLFLLWNSTLLRGARAAPKRTYVLWLITTLLTVAWLAYWNDFSKRWHDIEAATDLNPPFTLKADPPTRTLTSRKKRPVRKEK
jgi:hypothetical protein